MSKLIDTGRLQQMAAGMKQKIVDTSMIVSACHYDSSKDAFIITPSTDMEIQIDTFISGVFCPSTDYIEGKSFKLLNGMTYIDLTSVNTPSFAANDYVYFNIRRDGYITFRQGGSGGYKVGDILSPTQYKLINVVKGVSTSLTGTNSIKAESWYYGYHNNQANLLLFGNSKGLAVIDPVNKTVKATNTSIIPYAGHNWVFANNEHVYWMVTGNSGYLRTYSWDTLELVQDIALGSYIVSRGVAGMRPKHGFVDKTGQVWFNNGNILYCYTPNSSYDYTYSDQRYTQKSISGDLVGILYDGSTAIPCSIYAVLDGSTDKVGYLGPNTEATNKYTHYLTTLSHGTIQLAADTEQYRFRYEISPLPDRYCNAILIHQYIHKIDTSGNITNTTRIWTMVSFNSGLVKTLIGEVPFMVNAGYINTYSRSDAMYTKRDIYSSNHTTVNSQYEPILPQLIPNGLSNSRIDFFDVANTEGTYVDVRQLNDGSIEIIS